MPRWVPVVQCWAATGTPPWPPRHGLLDAPGGAVWLARWQYLTEKIAQRDAKQLAQLTGRTAGQSARDGAF